MSISGNLSAMPPEDLFQWISRGQKSGTLFVRNGNETRNVFVSEGAVVAVNSSRLRDRLGSILVHSHGLSSGQLDLLVSEQTRTGMHIGELVLKGGYVSRSQIDQALEEQIQTVFFELLGWVSGDFSFEERELHQNERLVSPIKISNLMLEGARRQDEMSRLRTLIPSENTVFKRCASLAITCETLDPLMISIAELTSTPITVCEILEKTIASEFATYEAIRRLIDSKIIIRDMETEAERIQVDVSIASTLQRVSTLVESKYFHEALELLHSMLNKAPTRSETKAEIKKIEKLLLQDAKRIIDSPNLVPKIRQSFSSMEPEKLQLTLQEGFVFSRIDGRTNIKMLKYVTSLSEDTLYIILHKFLRMGLAYLDKAPGAVKRQN